MHCTRCEGMGFLNVHQIEDATAHDEGFDGLHRWWKAHGDTCDVQPCDCCGDGTDWYGTPGEHYGPDDPAGRDGPYESNGGLCRCH